MTELIIAILALGFGYLLGTRRQRKGVSRHVRRAIAYWHANRKPYDAGA